MKSLVFDSSSVISLATNNLIWTLPLLKQKFKGEFFIPKAVKEELVDDPLRNRKFELEAVMLANNLAKEDLKFYKNDSLLNKKTSYLLDIANRIFKVDDHFIRILDRAEVEGLALASILNSEAYVVDERTIRLLVEEPYNLVSLLARKLNTKIHVNKENLNGFSREVKGVKIIRSSELMTIAFELGLFNIYKEGSKFYKDGLKKHLLEGLLWGLRLRGCAISTEEINDLLKLERFK